MSDIQIYKHNFELSKDKIQVLISNLPTPEQLPTLEKKGGLFNCFDKKVTGAEMNEITHIINDIFKKNKEQTLQLYELFREVYNTLEVLDKEYIKKILESIEASDIASKQALAAQSDIDRTIKALKITVSKLKEIEIFFTENPDEVLKMKNIGAMQEDVERHKAAISEISANFSAVSNLIEETHKAFWIEIDELKSYQSKLEKLIHLSDIDTTWKDVEKLKQKISDLYISIDCLKEETKIYLEKIEKSIQKSLLEVEQKISILEEYKSKLENYSHLKDIDDIWKNVQKHQEHLDSLNTHLSQTKIDLTKLDNITAKSFQETYSKINSKSELFEKRIRIAYWVAGGALFFSLLQFVLLMLKVL